MASAEEVPIVKTPKGARVSLGKLYMYPDGHANLVFPAVPEAAFAELNLPLTHSADVLVELATVVKKLQDAVVKNRPS